MNKAPAIFWLASWYPNLLDPYEGDFIKRHAMALSLYAPVHVLHIKKDEKGAYTKDILVKDEVNGNLHETIVYYHPLQTGIPILDKLLSTAKFLRTGKKEIRKKLASHANLLIHVHVAMRHGLLAIWANKKFAIPYLITEHWTGYDQQNYPASLRPPKWYWAATRRIFKKAGYFYPVSQNLGRLVHDTIAPIPFRPIANTVDTRYFYYKPSTWKTDTCFRFIHVSTLSYQKNIEGILNVAERMAKEKKPCSLTLIGPESEEVRARIDASPLLAKTVHLTGPLQYEEVALAMQNAHALLMFSRYENQPCVILEALCCGLPVVSTHVGGIAEVIDGSNGILTASGDEETLYHAINHMMENYEDYDRGSVAETAAAKYSYETIGRQLLSAYQQDYVK